MGGNLLVSIMLFLIVPLLIAVFLVLLPILSVIELVAMGVVGIMQLLKIEEAAQGPSEDLLGGAPGGL